MATNNRIHTFPKNSHFSRKEFLKGTGAGLLFPLLSGFSSDKTQTPVPKNNRMLLKGGTVLTLNDEIGDFEQADVLVDDGVIKEIAPSIRADAEAVDASGRIVMPGFVDTHRHMWQGSIRNILPNGLLSEYIRIVQGKVRPVFRAEDAYAGNLISALGAIDAGITTVLDWSHIGNSPDHTDAAISALRDSGIRAVYAYGSGENTPKNRHPDDLHHLIDEHFSTGESLLTPALATGINTEHWNLARDAGVRITVHVNGTGDLLPVEDQLGPDVTCIHCCNLLDEEWELLAEKGVGVSIASPVEMIMGHGIPPIQQTQDYEILPSLSVDVETTVPGDMFSQMQSVFTLQRMQILARERNGEENLPELLSAEEVLRFATINGAIHNGLHQKTGSLTPGKEADIIMLAKDDINVMPVNNAYGAVVNGMDRSNVEMVMIGGEIKKWNGQLVRDDLEEIQNRAMQSRAYIFEHAELEFDLGIQR
jgi:5-methylthioadenosine/S-adenosylhomocysteine deaminase